MRGVRRLFVAALLLVGCTHAPWNPYSGWKVARTKHITLYTDTKYLYTTTLESLEIAYAALGASLFSKRTIAPVEVLFLEWDQFLPTFGHYRNGLSLARLPGQGVLGRRGLIIVGEETHVPLAAHRLAHMFLQSMAPTAPLWLHEGYATYVQTIEYRAGKGMQEACLGKIGGGDPTVSLEQLFTWTWGQADESKKYEWYRFAARNLVDYFLTAEEGKLRPKFQDLLVGVTSGKDAKTVLAEIFPGTTVEDLEKKISEYRRESEVRPRPICPISFPIAADRAADFGKPRVEPLAKQDIEQLMFRLWLLPRRAGYMDFYPPSALTLKGSR